jgi:hypothetical protein
MADDKDQDEKDEKGIEIIKKAGQSGKAKEAFNEKYGKGK